MCMAGHWYALNVLYHMYYTCTVVLLNIQRRLQHLQNINFDKKIHEFGHFCPAWWSKMYLFVAILENGRHLGFSIDQSDGMDLITIEISHANFGACIIICTTHPKNANYLLHSRPYFCRTRDDSHEITRGMLKCNTKHTTIVWTHLY